MTFASNDLLALGAAACWASSAMLSVSPSRHLGAVAFTRWRMVLVALMLWAAVLAGGLWRALTPEVIGLMAASGLIGIFIGDSALFAAMNRLGPRRTGVLFATHALWSAVLGMAVFGERMNAQALGGALLTVSGVMVAVVAGRRREESHAWEVDHGSVGWGIALGLVAALGQSVGALIAKPAMSAGLDPVLASAVRVGVAALAHAVVRGLDVPVARAAQPLTVRVLAQTALNGFIGMGVGMSLLLWALRDGDVSTVGVLSSVTPVLVLPLLWLHVRRPPAWGAWVGAIMTVAGTALILTRATT